MSNEYEYMYNIYELICKIELVNKTHITLVEDQHVNDADIRNDYLVCNFPSRGVDFILLCYVFKWAGTALKLFC